MTDKTTPGDGTCGAEFVSADGAQSYTCTRDEGRHLSHRAPGGVRFVRAPGGAIITRPRTSKEIG